MPLSKTRDWFSHEQSWWRRHKSLFLLLEKNDANRTTAATTVVGVIFAVKIFSWVTLCAKIKRAEFSFFTSTHIYSGSHWAPSHKLELQRPLLTKYFCKCGSHEHKTSTLNSSSSITSRARRPSNSFVHLIFVRLIFAMTRDYENFLP